MIGRRGFVVGLVAVVVAACSGRLRQPDSVAPVATMDPTEPPVQGPTTDTAALPTEAPSSTPPTEPTPDEPTPEAVTALVLPVLCREAWGAAPAAPDEASHVPTSITVHHTAVVLDDPRRAPSRWRGYQRYHQDQGWSDVAYHVGVDPAGNVYELRDADVPGDTFTDYDPAGHHLIVADGNFDAQTPTPELVEAIAQAAAVAAARYGIDPATIDGHRDHASTSCPGEGLYAALPAIRARTAELLAAGGVEPVSRCGAVGAADVAAIESGT